MTLCIAWKDNEQVHFASDSRVSLGNDHYLDIAIKIFSIPVKIVSPTDAQTHQETLLYDHTIGMCFSGSSTNAYIVKESIHEVLSHLQEIPNNNISMNRIARIVRVFYEHTSRKICAELAGSGIATFFLSGYCPIADRIIVYKFSIDDSVATIRAYFEEVLIGGGIEILGNGEMQAREILEYDPDISKFKLVKQVINDPAVESVGGNIQYGTFEANDFYVRGVQDYKIEPNNEVRILFNLRGTELYREDFNTDYHISYKFIMPFEQDIADALRHHVT